MSGAVAAVIPARIGSTRLPEKPLLRETGKYLIQHVYERVRAARHIERVLVATDEPRIAEAVRSFGGEAVLTAREHQSGTDRVAEAARALDARAIINVQGDEPEIDPEDLERVALDLARPDAQIVTLAVEIEDAATWLDPNAVKVVVGAGGDALYFTRAPVPWSADFEKARAARVLLKHLGVYGFTRETLFRFARLPPAPLEPIERLEQLRALHHGVPIRVLRAGSDSIGIDTAEDYRRFVDKQRAQTRERS
ncbi:MAG: 3-deoxy-manno-octulosonate cytidylyltransferase [Planctomycetes bacterium]|nr:3-deoxy-manno-octulosonate cytidylyltransferase [Planctomycetota bacterium]